MSKVSIHELIAWDLDEYPYRDSGMNLSPVEFAARVARAKDNVAGREGYIPCDALLEAETRQIQELLAPYTGRAELQQEYAGLEWTLGVIDLRCVLAFQRRLVFDPEVSRQAVPQQNDWPGLVSLALGSQRSTEYSVALNRRSEERLEIRLESRNPDLQVRLATGTGHNGVAPFSLYGGSPFFEVAELRGRWFLRDGYHRAYGLLCAGVCAIPAVIVRARTIEEVGATQPWFFSEEQLFSARPPRVMDFLDESLVIRYSRQRLIKTIRIEMEDSLQPFCETEVQGDDV